MKSALAQDTTNTAKNLAAQIAKQMAQEPIEILKDVKEQTGIEASGQLGSEAAGQQPQQEQNKALEQQRELNDKMKSSRRMEALNRELADIHRQKVFEELQQRISNGEVIPLAEYSELSMEQKQVLKAQMEAVKTRMLNAKYSNDKLGVPSIVSKPSRRFGAGQKHEAEKQQTRVEKPVPPSG